MTSRRTTVMLTLAGSMILLLAGGDAWAKDQVERPFFIHGDNTIVVADVTSIHVDELGPYWCWEGWGSGVATYSGKFTMEGAGRIYLDEYGPIFITGSGCTTAANGDEVFWKNSGSLLLGTNQVTFTGGTGRFEDASGGFSSDSEPKQELDGSSLTITYSYTGSGTVKY